MPGAWPPSQRPREGQPIGGLAPRKNPRPSPQDQYGSLRASLLFCPQCRQATPTRERLLLVLPSGNLFEYLCAACGTSTGSKTDQAQADTQLFIP